MLALEGVRVLDLSRYAPALFVGMMLGDMGAEVIKVDEPPLNSSAQEAAERGGFPDGYGVGRSHPAFALNRNKRSIVLNLKVGGGRDVFGRLADSADVLLEGFRPGVASRLGVDYATLSARNPRLVYCSLSGYGQEGPYSHLSGHDLNYASISGALALTGAAGGPPVQPGFLFADFAGGSMFAFSGILLALLARERTGRGQYVDAAMTDGVVQLLTTEFSAYFGLNMKAERGRHWLSGIAPYYSVYQCADGRFVSLAPMEPAFWANLCHVLGMEQYADVQGDRSRWPEMRAALEEMFLKRPRDEWFALLRDANVCIAPVNEIEEAANDPHLRQRGMFIDLPAANAGGEPTATTQVGFGIKLSDTPARICSLAPTPGQHTDSIMKSLDYSAEEIAGLRAAGAVY